MRHIWTLVSRAARRFLWRRKKIMFAFQAVMCEVGLALARKNHPWVMYGLPMAAIFNSTVQLYFSLSDYKREWRFISLEARILLKAEISLSMFCLAVAMGELLEVLGVFDGVHLPCGVILVGLAFLMLYYQILRDAEDNQPLLPLHDRRQM